MSNVFVSVIIVTTGRKDYLEPCMESLKKQADSDMEVNIIYTLPEKLSFCQALNKGIAKSKADYVLCLNDDVVLDKKFIHEALAGFNKDRKIGMVSGKILRRDGVIIDSTGLFLTPWRTAKERGYGAKDIGQYEKEGFIFGVNGAVAFYRRKMLEDIKQGEEYFDSDFRFFYEDLDIAWQAQRFGWKAYYVPGAVAYHLRGGTARIKEGINKKHAFKYLINDELQLDLIKNRYLAIIKNESLTDFILHLPFILAYDLIACAFLLFYKPGLFKNIFLNLKYIRSAFKKRRRI